MSWVHRRELAADAPTARGGRARATAHALSDGSKVLAARRDAALVSDLLAFLRASPSPFHCAAQCWRRLREAGFTRLRAAESWPRLAPGRGYFTAGPGHLIAFRVGERPSEHTGARIVAAHTDSPGLRLQPRTTRPPSSARAAEGRLDVDVYGSPLLYTWLDRDLGLAGRVVLERGGRLHARRVHIAAPVARIPSLAIHLNPRVNEAGLVLNRARHLPAVFCSASRTSARSVLAKLLEAALGERAGAIRAHDLFLVDTQPPALAGARHEFIQASRLDNQAMCHAALCALTSARPSYALQVVALFDHEEIGSHTERGADATLLPQVLGRVAGAGSSASPRMAARSLLVSADMGHAVHPNHPELHDESYRPLLNHGPMIKTNASVRFGAGAWARATIRSLCERDAIALQEYVNRPDLQCGSTLGPKCAAWLGVPVVDIGNPLLSMHSVREMCGTHDHAPMVRLLAAFLEG